MAEPPDPAQPVPPVPPRDESFEAFMGRALYDSCHGYYTCGIRDVGAAGDFSTSATLAPDLGIAVAEWIRRESRLHPGVRNVIEAGPGSGALSAVVRRRLGVWPRWNWHLVEASPVLRGRQRERLGGSVCWHETMQEALRACGGEALIFHNELLDAFPVIRVEWKAGGWREIWLEWNAHGAPVEKLRPHAVPEPERYSVLGFSAAEGQRCELQRAARDWLLGWAGEWGRGSVLAVDYGDDFPALYRRRPKGTVRAYLRQERSTELYANVGRQDLTADVNFTDYLAWASELGWERAGYQTQAEFLGRFTPAGVWGWLRERLVGGGARGAASRFLRDPEGAGGAFRCVWHRRGLPGGGEQA